MTTRKLSLALALLLVAYGSLSISGAQDRDGSFALAYGLDQGASFTLSFERWQKNDRTFMGNRMVDEHRYGYEDRFTVLDDGGDGLDLEIRYGDRWLLQDGQGHRDGPDYSELNGEQARFRLSAHGLRSDFEGFEALPVIRIPSRGDELNEERYKLELLSYFPALPGKPVKEGDSWTHRDAFQDPNSGSPLDVVLEHEYTFTGPIADLPGQVGFTDRFTVHVFGSVDAGGLLLELDMHGEGVDRYRFDTRRCMIAGSEGEMRVEGRAVNAEMEIEAPLCNDYKTGFEVKFSD